MTTEPSEPTLPVGDAELIARLRAEFVAAIRADPAVRIETYLANLSARLQEPALRELLGAELRWRRRGGEPLDVEAYVARFPDHAAAVREAFAALATAPAVASPAGRAARAASGLLLRCPHCDHPIELVAEVAIPDVRCTSCGGAFSLMCEAAEPPEELPRLGHFRRLRLLGRGAFGDVWLGHDERLDREVAIKTPRARRLDQRQQEQFIHEARMAAQLRHPHIVPVYEVGREGDALYIVSEFIRGTTLETWRKQQRPAPRESAALCATVAAALDHAHRQGVIHRDLKPANILMDDAGAPHITDFGLARREAAQITMTLDGAIIGTPAYMSPEQARGDSRQADARSDVYALGVILFELVTGELPFRGNLPTLIEQVIHAEPPSPRTLNASVPRDLETLTLRCLSKEPHRRLPTAQALADELNRFLAGEPIQSRPTTRAERLWRWSRRNPVVAALGSAVLGLLTLVAIAGPLAALRQATLRRAAETSQRQSQTRLVRQYASNGQRLVDAGDALAALPWYVAALKEVGDDPREAELHRIRLGVMLRTNPRLERLLPHDGAVVQMQFSPDGRQLATAGSDRRAYIWNVDSGRPATPKLEHDDPVMQVAYSPDGLWLATVAGDRTGRRGSGSVRIWNARTGAPRTAPLRHQPRSDDPPPEEDPDANPGYIVPRAGVIRDVAWSPDGARIVTGSDDQTVRVWDAATGEPLRAPFTFGKLVESVSFSPDGAAVLVAGEDQAQVLEATDMQPRFAPLRTAGRTKHAAFSPDGATILTASFGAPEVWNARTGAQILSLKDDGGWFAGAVFDPSGRRIVVSRQFDDTARVWDLADSRWATIGLAQPDVQAAGFLPDGRRLWTSGAGARVWRATTGTPLTPPLPIAGGAAAASPDGRRLATAAGRGVAVWDLAFDQPTVLPSWGAGGSAVVLDGQATRLARFATVDVAGRLGSGGRAQAWDLAAGAPTTRLLPHELPVGAATFSADGQRLVTCSGDSYPHPIDDPDHPGEAQVWDATSSAPLTPPLAHPRTVTCAAFSPDGARLATGAADNVARVWSVDRAETTTPPMPHPHALKSVAFAATGDVLLTTCSGGDPWSGAGEARLWNAATGEPNSPPLVCPGLLKNAWLNADGRRVVTLSSRMRGDTQHTLVQIWDAAAGRALSEPIRVLTDVEPLLSPDGRTLACTGGLYALASGAPLRTWPAPVLAASFAGRRDRVFTGDMRLRDATTGDPVAPPLPIAASRTLAAFSPDARLLATAYDAEGAGAERARSVRLWNADTGEALSQEYRFDAYADALDFQAIRFTPDGRRLAVVAGASSRTVVWSLDLAPARDSVETLAAQASALSGHEIDDVGGYAAVSPLDTWKRLPELRRADTSNDRAAAALLASEAAQAELDYDSFALAWLAAQRIRHEPRQAGPYAQAGRAAALGKQWPAAVANFDRAVELDAADADAWYGRGAAHAALGNWNDAIADLNRAVELRTSESDALLHLAVAHAQAGDAADARQALDRYLAPYAETLVEQLLGAHVVELEARGHWAGVELLLDALLALDNLMGLTVPQEEFGFDRPTALFHRGLARQRRGRHAEAIVDLSEVLVDHPVAADVLRTRGHSRAETQQWAEAARDFHAALDAAGPDATIGDFGAWALAELGAGDAAAFRRAAEALLARFGDTDSPAAAGRIAWICAAAPGGPAALAFSRRAVAGRPDDALAQLVLAAAMYRAEKLDDARHALEKLQLDDDNAGFRRALMALLAARQGDRAQADEHLTAAREILAAVRRNATDADAPAWQARLRLALLIQEAEALEIPPPP